MYIPTEQRISIRPYQVDSPPAYTVETLLEKGSGALNEDVLFAGGDLFGVFDGATSLGKDHLPIGLTGGLIAAQIAANAFQQGGHDLSRSALTANRLIDEAILNNNLPQDMRHQRWSTSAAVVRVGADHLEYCQTGDSLILLIQRDGSFRHLTPETDHDRETLDLWKKSDPSSQATIHDTLSAQIREVRLQMNVSYGVLNGEPEAMQFINHGREELDGISAILLFTDGLFIPREHPQQKSDWDSFVDLYRQGGLGKIRDHVRSLQKQDPTCRKFPRFKPHDDIAAIAVKLDAR